MKWEEMKDVMNITTWHVPLIVAIIYAALCANLKSMWGAEGSLRCAKTPLAMTLLLYVFDKYH